MANNLSPLEVRQALIDLFDDILLEWEQDRKINQSMLSEEEIDYDNWTHDGKTMGYKQRLLDILSDMDDN